MKLETYEWSFILARRDPKVQRKVDKTLKVLKSSKKFYTGDRELDENTELTLNNSFSLPDEDDYGFESKTSEALHLRLMEKYRKMPEENKFSSGNNNTKSKPSTKSSNDNGDSHFHNGQRQRVSKIKSEITSSKPSKSKASIGAATSSKSTKQHHSSSSSSLLSSSKFVENKVIEKPKPKPKLKAAPIVNFEELLKLAEKKQHEGE